MGESDERREARLGRRESDGVVDYRLEALEALTRALGPAVAQVARLDDAIDDLERWIADERGARRQHGQELLDRVREINDTCAAHKRATEEAVEALRAEIKGLRLDARSGRRALIGSMLGAAATIVVALIGAAALIVTSHG